MLKSLVFEDINSYEPIVVPIECKEKVDIKLLNRLINSNLLKITKDKKYENRGYENERHMLEQYSKGVNKSGYINVKYICNKKIGRRHPERSLSYCSMRREVRHTLCKNEYVDIDMKNCHPSILYNIIKLNKDKFQGISTKVFKKFVKDRDEYIKELIEKSGNIFNKDDIKKLNFRSMYNGSIEGWFKEMEEKYGITINIDIQHFEKLKTELNNISQIVCDYNPNFYNHWKKAIGYDSNNEYGSFISYYLQEWERRILDVVYNYVLKKSRVKILDCVLCFDGIMITQKLYTTLNKDNKFLEELNRIVKDNTGFDILFEKKDMNLDLFEELEKYEKEYEDKLENNTIDQSKLYTMDEEYFNSLPNYRLKCKYFNNFICRIREPQPCYVFYTYQGDGIIETGTKRYFVWTENELKTHFKTFKVDDFDKDGKIVQVKFIDKWLDDFENQRKSNRMEFKPFNGIGESHNKHYFNLFMGLNPNIYAKYDSTKDWLREWNKLCLSLCEGDEKFFTYFKNYIAFRIQYPDIQLGLSFMIIGKQGCGKNMFLKSIFNLYDETNVISSANPLDFFGTHANGYESKIWVNINEMEGKTGFDFESLIKAFITEPVITVNPKGIKPYNIKNYSTTIIFSNKENQHFDIASGDRRFVIFKATNEFLDKTKYNQDYWKKLNILFNRPEFIACLYNHLNSLDVKDFDFHCNRPITSIYKDIMKRSIPYLSLFINQFIDSGEYINHIHNKSLLTNISQDISNKTIKIKGSDMFELFKDFKTQNDFNEKYKIDIRSFYSKLTELDFIHELSTLDGYTFINFIPNVWKQNIINKKWSMDTSLFNSIPNSIEGNNCCKDYFDDLI